MESYTLNRKSWHFYLASEWGQRIYLDEGPIDICTYIRRVVIGAIKLLLATIFLGLLFCTVMAVESSFLYCAYQFLFGDFDAITNQHVLGFAAIGTFINGFFAVIGLVTWFNNNRAKIPTPGFVSLAAKKFKSKTCFMVEFK